MYKFDMVGAQFRPTAAQAETITLTPGTSLGLTRDPYNKFDSFAIEVRSLRTGEHLGFVPKHIAAELAPKIDDGRNFICSVVANKATKKPTLQILEVE